MNRKNKYIGYFFCIVMALSIIYVSVYSTKTFKKVRQVSNSIARVINIIRDGSCELFSESVGVCNSRCTKTACGSIKSVEFLKEISQDMLILEIGPYINPTFKGENVKYFDVLSTEDIKKQILSEEDAAVKNYVDSNANLSNVPNIDYVIPNGDMSGIKDKFDVVFSAHNIEHQIDLINHLNQVADLLNKDGKFYLVVPDKRYCFDHFIPESPLSDIIDSNYESSKNIHPLRIILAMNCETTHNNANRHWRGDHGVVKGENSECYAESLKNFKKQEGKYTNAHRWRFTPQQFEFIVNELYKMKLIPLKIEKIYVTQKNAQEFRAVLYKP